jgi:hypothetical protein
MARNNNDDEVFNDDEALPESAMGGASDAGAHGKHPASAAKLDGRSALPDAVPGDAAIERRHHRDSNYNGPERRVGAAKDVG